MYKNIIFLIISTAIFSGCVNERGISSKYYNDCREYYDARGYYRTDCDENIIEFEDVKEGSKDLYNSAKNKLLREENKEPEHKVVW